MKKIILLSVYILIASLAVAQPRVHVGITTGFNTTYVLDKGLASDPRYAAEANYEWAPIGGSLGIDITRKFGLQFESIRAAQGQIYQMVQTVQAVDKMIAERNIDLNYLQFPMLLKFMGGGNKATRFNFQVGPQLSFLNSGAETITFVENGQFNFAEGGDIPIDATNVIVGSHGDIPASYLQALENGEVTPPSSNELEIPLSYFEDSQNPGEYNMPQDAMMTLMSSEANSQIQQFKEKEVQLAFGFGMDIDVLKHFYLSANVRANYSFTDMRNDDLIEFIGDEDLTGIFESRSNLLVGAQIGLHWMIGGNRSYKAKKKALETAEETIR